MSVKRSISTVSILLLCLSGLAGSNKRAKRELRFPKGSSLVVATSLASFLPKGITQGMAHVLEFDLGFPFPEQFAINKVNVKKKLYSTNWKKSSKIKKYRPKRSLKEEQQLSFLYKIQDVITRVGLNGAACVSRLQCELEQVFSKNSLIEELLVALFKTSRKFTTEQCKEFENNCSISLLHVLLHSEQI